MAKKLLSVLLIISVCLFTVSCNRENRFSFPELLRRLEENSKDMSFDMNEAFFSEEKWFLFVSVCSEDDMLITATENPQSRYLEEVSVSVVDVGNENQTEEFIRLCEAVADAFIFDCDSTELLKGVGLYIEDAVFSEDTYFYEEGRFSLSFFNADIGSTLVISIVR